MGTAVARSPSAPKGPAEPRPLPAKAEMFPLVPILRMHLQRQTSETLARDFIGYMGAVLVL